MLHPHCSSLSIAATSDGVRIVVSSQRSPSLVSPPSHLWSSQWKHPFRTGSQALLTMLDRATDRLCRAGAPVKNLAHSASLHSNEKSAPLKPGIKHLDPRRSDFDG